MIALRSALFQLWFWAYSIPMNLLWAPSLLMPRAVLRKGIEWWVWGMLGGMRAICGLGFEVRGREHIPEGGVLIASKHFSMWETAAFSVILKDPAIILKKELLAIPFYGWYARKIAMIAINRAAGPSAIREMTAQARARLDAGRPVVIFPEGTRRAVGAAPDYKPGIAGLYARLDAPVVPVAHTSGLYWRGKSWLRFPGTIVIEFLPAIPPGMPRGEFMSLLETRIETATNRLLAEARAAGVAFPAAAAQAAE